MPLFFALIYSLATLLLPFKNALSSFVLFSLEILLLASDEEVEAVFDVDWDCTEVINGDILEWTSFKIDMYRWFSVSVALRLSSADLNRFFKSRASF